MSVRTNLYMPCASFRHTIIPPAGRKRTAAKALQNSRRGAGMEDRKAFGGSGKAWDSAVC